MTDAELAEYWKHQTIHWRNLALRYHQELLASKNTPEKQHGRTTLHRDPTGHQAAANVDRQRKNRKAGQPWPDTTTSHTPSNAGTGQPKQPSGGKEPNTKPGELPIGRPVTKPHSNPTRPPRTHDHDEGMATANSPKVRTDRKALDMAFR